jgi:hypothetical protein
VLTELEGEGAGAKRRTSLQDGAVETSRALDRGAGRVDPAGVASAGSADIHLEARCSDETGQCAGREQE